MLFFNDTPMCWIEFPKCWQIFYETIKYEYALLTSYNAGSQLDTRWGRKSGIRNGRFLDKHEYTWILVLDCAKSASNRESVRRSLLDLFSSVYAQRCRLDHSFRDIQPAVYWWKKGHWFRDIQQVGLTRRDQYLGYLWTRINISPRESDHVLRLEDFWSWFVTQTGTKGPFGIKFIFFFWISLFFLFFYFYLFL
jgi:hypothetical protein